jgi:N-acetyl sugar amidotransferase
VKFCKRCILPDTRPGLRIGPDGVCSACAAHEENSATVDWSERAEQFEELITSTTQGGKRSGPRYDCVIPVSGGKDSTWQVVTCLEHGLHPLAVSWKPPARTKVGARNLANLINLGVDHIDFQINPQVERKFLYRSLSKFGSTAIPMHLALFGIPLTIAVRFDIPLVVWGENSAEEYGGTDDPARGHQLDSAWRERWGVTAGTLAQDWVSEDLTTEELTPYFGPSDEEMSNAGVRAVFLGYFFNWDPSTSLAVAQSHGFERRQEGPKTGYYDYADIDDDFISIHHYLKWYKFGFTRLFDNLSLEIRKERMTRDQAIEVVRQYREQMPEEDIAQFCEFVNINTEHFFEIIEPFRNHDIWVQRNGVWMIDDFLIPDWEWR